jgi:hypothetical protein
MRIIHRTLLRKFCLVCWVGASSIVLGLCCGQSPPACFSPTQSLDIAYEPGAIGCVCTTGKDEDVCVPDSNGRLVALTCRSTRWQAVEDGACGV